MAKRDLSGPAARRVCARAHRAPGFSVRAFAFASGAPDRFAAASGKPCSGAIAVSAATGRSKTVGAGARSDQRNLHRQGWRHALRHRPALRSQVQGCHRLESARRAVRDPVRATPASGFAEQCAGTGAVNNGNAYDDYAKSDSTGRPDRRFSGCPERNSFGRCAIASGNYCR